MLLCGIPLLDFAQDTIDKGWDYCYYRYRKFDHDDNLCNDNPWILVFEDEFDGHGIDKSVWLTKLRNGWRLRPGKEQQYYTFDGSNYEVANGIIDLIARAEDYVFSACVCPDCGIDSILVDRISNQREFKYTSCNIQTKRKFSFGRFEASVKLPKGKGFWPAFWLHGGDFENVERYNELDIFEFWNEDDFWGNYDPDKLSKYHLMTTHFESQGEVHFCQRKREYGIDFSDDFNEFSVDWERNRIVWYVNGKKKRKKNKLMWGRCEVKENTYYFTNVTHPEDPMNLILNLAIQGNDSIPEESPDADTPFPSQMRVDRVKVWYRMDLGDVVIATPSQLILHNELFNAVTGNNVTIKCGYVVPRGQQLSLSASDNVILRTGFVAEAGSVFNVRSKQPIYDSKSDEDYEDDDEEEYEYYTDGLRDERPVDGLVGDFAVAQRDREGISTDGFHLSANGSYSSSDGLYVYPNPSYGVFRIQLPSAHGKHSVSITDLNGHAVFAKEADAAENISIDISTLPKGVYMLQVVSFNSEYNNYQKIVLL